MWSIVTEAVVENAFDAGIILALFFGGRILTGAAAEKIIAYAESKSDSSPRGKKRARTLGRLAAATGNAVVYAVVLLMVLSLFGADIRPILAGAGVAGLAIGFGAQSLVKDFVSGVFILIEDRYGVGDRVKIGGFEGEVAEVTLRSTVLKNEKGEMFYVSNGSIKEVVNKSRAADSEKIPPGNGGGGSGRREK